MYTFRQYVLFNSLPNFKLFEEETSLDDIKFFKLPIKDGVLSATQVSNIKAVLKNYIENFNLILQNNYDIDDEDDRYYPGVYINLPFAVIGRGKNCFLCAYDTDYEIYSPFDMNERIAKQLLKNLYKIQTLRGVIEPSLDNLLTIAYETKIMLSDIGNYCGKKEIEVYIKFDFRPNKDGWDRPNGSNRFTSFDIQNQSEITVPYDDSKLCFISFHPSNLR